MNATADVVVVGGGIAGLTVALALADAGAQVVIADEPRPGAASRASAGMLAAGLGFPAIAQDAAVAAREAYPVFLDRLRAATGCDVPLDRRGIVELPSDGGLSGSGASAHLDPRALADLEPPLAGHAEAVFHPLDGAVEPASLMDALEQAVALHRCVGRARMGVVALHTADAGYSVQAADGTRLHASRLVLAAGAWANELRGLLRPLPVRPVLGELLLLPTRPLGHVVYGMGGYLIPRRDGILVGATSEERGFGADTTDAGRSALLDIAARLMPSLRGLPVLRHWAGLRPVSPDGLPILGADPVQPGVAYACGLSRNGILFAPWAAVEVAREVAGERSAQLAPFRVDRFGGLPVRD